MSYRNRLAALLLTTALVTAPCLASAAYAHEHGDWDGSAQTMECKHEHFTEAQRKLLQETMHKLHEGHKQAFEEMHKLHESLHKVLSAESFDGNAFLSLASQIEAKRVQLEKSHAEAFASIAGQFTPEQRVHLMHMFRHHHHGDMHHAGMRDDREGHEGWHHHDGHEGWFHHGDNDQNPTTIGQYQNDGYPPYTLR